MDSKAPKPSLLRREEILPERDFLEPLAGEAVPLRRLARRFRALPAERWAKTDFARLGQEANEFESFLDDFGARDNRTYAFLTELVASVRWFALAGESLRHLEGRLDHYEVEASVERGEDFRAELRETLAFVAASAGALLAAFEEEASLLGLPPPPAAVEDGEIPEVRSRPRLPRNADEAEVVGEGRKIAEVASLYLRTADLFARVDARRIEAPEERRRAVAQFCTEERARAYEATVHTLQSKYDTYIQATPVGRRDGRLPKLRGHVSIALHLLEAVVDLVHFYERHENDIRYEPAKSRIAAVIDKNAVLDRAWNFGLHHAAGTLARGRPLAEAVLAEYSKTVTVDLELPPAVYLHARPASLIVSVVNHHGMPVEMEIEGDRCGAGSILQVMILAGTHPESRRIRFHGDERPLRDLRLLFDRRFAEDGLATLPDALAYLRGE